MPAITIIRDSPEDVFYTYITKITGSWSYANSWNRVLAVWN